MQTKKLTFEGATGATLSARLELPVDDNPLAFALFAHCFTCSKNYRAVVNISRALARSRIGVLRFDFTGLGESEGSFAETTFSSNVEDLVAAARFLDGEWGAPSIIIGHSLGGAAVLQAAREIPSSRAVVTIGAPAEPTHVRRHLRSSIEEIEETGAAEVMLAGRPFTITKKFLDDLNQQNMDEVIAGLDRALLVFHSPDDEIVGPDNGQRIYERAAFPKNFVSLPGADHLLSREEDSHYVGSIITAWARRYLGASESGIRVEEAGADVVVRTGRGRYHTEVLAGRHGLTADEPESVGGTDTGPTPWGLLMASLGACTTITLRMYADRKEWPLEEVTARVLRRNLEPSETTDGDAAKKSVEIGQALTLVGDLDEEQRDRLLEIAHRCPVHRALDVGLRMPIELEEEGS